MTVRIDDRGWPLIRVDYSGPLTMADHEALTVAVDDLYGRGRRFALVFATRPDGRGDRGVAKAQVAWLDAERERLARWVAGWGTVASAEEKAAFDRGRGAAMAARMPFPTGMFTSVSEATAWAAERLADPADAR